MSLISIQYVFSTGATIIASQHNSNNSVIFNDYNGNITDANIAAGAGIEYTKLALSNSIKSTDIASSTVLSASNLPVGTSANNIVQLNGSAQLPAVDGSLLTSITQGNLSNILNYGNSTSSSSSVNQTSLKICFGNNISIGANGGTVAITNLPFSTSSYTVVASANSGFDVPGGGTDQTAGMVYAYINSSSQFTVYNTDDQTKTFSWFAIGT